MLYAKRNFNNGVLEEETLQEHIEYCLCVYRDIVKTFPEAISLFNSGEISGKEIIFLTVCLHDMGKSAKQFQDITLDVNTKDYWNFRHELLSTEFVDLIGLPLKRQDKDVMKIAILAHHERNIDELGKVSFSELNNPLILAFDDEAEEMLSMRKAAYEDAKEGLKCNWGKVIDILNNIKNQYYKEFGKYLTLSDIYSLLGNVVETVDDYRKSTVTKDKAFDYRKILLLKGILITCDHLGSGHNAIEAICGDIKDYYIKKFRIGVNKLADFKFTQKACIDLQEDALLISPTGSGKTEASFLWANNHIKSNNYRRIFYVLPYTASINAMGIRLEGEEFSAGKVDLKHGKSLYSQYVRLLDEQMKNKDINIEDKREISNKARLVRQLSKEISKPIKIVTPHQIIKAFFKVKGFEILMTEFHNSVFIFDEIHCYDKEILSMVLTVMKVIKSSFAGRLFFMSATFPRKLKDLIKDTLSISKEIHMPENELSKYVKHKVNLIDGTIEDNMGLIKNDLHEGKRVLVVCNTLKKAQMIFKNLSNEKAYSLLLHSYFAPIDRKKIEDKLLLGEKHRDGFIPVQLLVGTQAIEVSLDLDFDTIYTELAPIDALVQRFGRVYRNRILEKGGFAVANIFNKYDIGSDIIYNKEICLLDKTLEKLNAFNGQLLDDNKMKTILDYVYDDNYLKTITETLEFYEYKMKNTNFIPLSYSRESEEFFEQFDGIKVCPQYYEKEYKDCIDNNLYIEAEGYLVTVAEYKASYYIRKKYILPIIVKGEKRRQNILFSNPSFLDYSPEIGLIETGAGCKNEIPL